MDFIKNNTSNYLTNIFVIPLLVGILNLTSCTSSLSNYAYETSDLFHIVLRGKVIDKREVLINKNNHHLYKDLNTGNVKSSNNSVVDNFLLNNSLIVGGNILINKSNDVLSKQSGIQYIIKVDLDDLEAIDTKYKGKIFEYINAIKMMKIISVIQAKEIDSSDEIKKGDKILVIISDKSSSVIKNNI